MLSHLLCFGLAIASGLAAPNLYVVGGDTGSVGCTNSVQAISSLNNSFVNVSCFAVPGLGRSQGGMVNYQGNLVLLGGKDAGGTRSNLVTAFDGLAWKSWPAMHTGRQWGSYAVFNSAIFAIGGLTTTRDSTSLVEYFTNNTWQSGPSLPVKMRSGAAAVYQDKLFYLGGYDESSGTSATIYTLAQGAKTWGTTISMPQPSLDHGTVLFNNQLYLLGGNIRNSGTMSNQVWRLEGSSWQEMPAMQQARGIAGMVVFEDRLLVAGGTTSYHPKAGQKTVEAFDGIRWTFQQPLVAGVFDTQIGVL